MGSNRNGLNKIKNPIFHTDHKCPVTNNIQVAYRHMTLAVNKILQDFRKKESF